MAPCWVSKPHKTVVLLGAAASKASDSALPTMQGFFDRPLSEPLRRFLEWFYPGEAAREYNLEEVPSYLYISQSRIPAWTGAAALGLRNFEYRELLDFVVDRSVNYDSFQDGEAGVYTVVVEPGSWPPSCGWRSRAAGRAVRVMRRINSTHAARCTAFHARRADALPACD
jgi:hypothetical protein